MLFRLQTWLVRWKDSSKKRIGTGFIALAVLLSAITAGTGVLVVQMLNERDLQRITQVGQLQLDQSVKQIELISQRFSALLATLAQDDNFLAQAALTATHPQALNPQLKRLLTITPIANHLMWLDPTGRVQASLRRVNGQPEWVDGDTPSDIRQIEGLQNVLSIQPQQLWFSDFVAIKTETFTNSAPLIYGAVRMSNAQGQALGYLLIGMDIIRFAQSFTQVQKDPSLPQVWLLDHQGAYLGTDPARAAQWSSVKQDQAKLWADLLVQPVGAGGQGNTWRHVDWGGQRAGEHQVVRNNKLILLSAMTPEVIKQTMTSNAQLVSGIWGSGLALLLTAVGLLYGRSHSIEVYRQREAAIRRIVGLGYWRFHPSRQHLELSGVFHKTLSLSGNPQQLWQAWLATFDTDENRRALQAAIQNTLLTGQGFELEVLMHNRQNGAKGWGLMTGTRSPDNPAWIEGSVQHITRRKQAEIDAQASRSDLRDIVDWARLGVWEFDLVKGERRINCYLRDMLGLDMPMRGEYVNFNWATISHPDDVPAAAQARLDYIAGKTRFYSAKLRVQHTLGHWVWFVLEGEHVAFDESGQPTLIRGIAIDVTELQEARQDAEEANQAKTRFLSRMSHELRTPLNGIMGYTQLLQLSPHLDAQERDHVNAVLAGSRHLLNLINDLLQITSDELHNLPIKPQPVNLSELALRCTTLMQPLMIEKQLTLHNRMSAEHWVMADSLRAQQCIINVLANAIKYSASNTAITLEVSAHAAFVRLSIRDQGPGIAAEVGQQVFEPFYRVQDTLTGVDGAGIGLAVVQRLVENMNGHISYESTLGVGTVFHLDLPLAPAPATHKKTPSSQAGTEANATKLVANSFESIS